MQAPSFTRGVVFRERVEVIGGRVFPSTYRFDFDGEPIEVDAAKSLWALGHGLIPARGERTMAALVLRCLEQQPIPLPGEDAAPTDVDQVLDAARRLVAVGAVGHDDERGGYLVPRYDVPAAFRR
ncbi:hypothetical protein ACIRL2_49945 [Embleya sp. NPDC127516]|uniref:hypothetical protein n=1 Tax=Embleya sp. NPDC127516 TaxID=3363990 RepID=UPI0038288431